MTATQQEKIDRVIAAALQEFARAGKEGARIDAIAAAAGMNKRLLYHYVGDKEALFSAALAASVTRLAGSTTEPLPASQSLDTNACWRILVFAEGMAERMAEGMAEGMKQRIIADGLRQTGESATETTARIALEVFGQLLPGLKQALLEGSEPDPTVPEGLKPRIRLKPELRRGR